MVMSAYYIEGRTRMSALLTVPGKFTSQVRVRVSRETKRAMKKLVKQRAKESPGLKPSDLYREAIEAYLQEQGGVADTTASAAREAYGGHTESA